MNLISLKNPWAYVQGLLLTIVISCHSINDNSDSRYERINSKFSNKLFEVTVLDSFFLPYDTVKDLVFTRIGTLNSEPIFYGLNKKSYKIEVFNLTNNNKKEIDIFKGLTLSPHLYLSNQDSIFIISNGYEFGTLIYTIKGNLIWSGLKGNIKLKNDHIVVANHFDLNDTHVSDGDTIFYRISRHSMGGHEKEFYKDPAYLGMSLENQSNLSMPVFQYPKKYLGDKYHSRDFALSSIFTKRKQLIVSISRDSCLYLIEQNSKQKFKANSKFHQDPELVEREYDLQNLKESIKNDGYYSFLLYNSDSEILYRFYKHPIKQQFSISIFNYKFDKLGETNKIENRDYSLQYPNTFKDGILFKCNRLSNNGKELRFDYISFSNSF